MEINKLWKIFYKERSMSMFVKARILNSIFILALAGGILCACSVPSPNPNSSVAPSVDNGLEVVYFHRTHRCYGCTYAEDGVRYTIENYFADELASGELVFMSIDVQDEENATIVDKYGAYTSSLFMNKVVDGVEHIDEIKDIWFALGDDQAFTDIVMSEIGERLE